MPKRITHFLVELALRFCNFISQDKFFCSIIVILILHKLYEMLKIKTSYVDEKATEPNIKNIKYITGRSSKLFVI